MSAGVATNEDAVPAVPLDGGRRLLVRPVAADDASALEALYGAMSDEDRHRRFFCSYRPPRSWFDDLARPGLHGGARLVAEVVTGEATELVAEAGFVGLPNGNGELAL